MKKENQDLKTSKQTAIEEADNNYVINKGTDSNIIISTDANDTAVINLNNTASKFTCASQGITCYGGVIKSTVITGDNQVEITSSNFTWNGTQIATINDISGGGNNSGTTENALTLQTNGTTRATFDGSAPVTFNVTPQNIGAQPTGSYVTTNQIFQHDGDSVAIGRDATASSRYNVSIGGRAGLRNGDTSQYAISIGFNAHSEITYGMAIGYDSAVITADRTETAERIVSFGDSRGVQSTDGSEGEVLTKSRLINVKAGKKSYDAVNLSQLNRSSLSILSELQEVVEVLEKIQGNTKADATIKTQLDSLKNRLSLKSEEIEQWEKEQKEYYKLLK